MTGHKLIAQSPHFQQYRQDGGGLGWGDRKIKQKNEIKIWRKETIVGLTQRKKKLRKGKLSKKHKRKEKGIKEQQLKRKQKRERRKTKTRGYLNIKKD